MAKIDLPSVAALLVCLMAVNAAFVDTSRDEQGNRCKPCATTLEYRPVCGSNGQTYPNPSSLVCHNECLKAGVTQKYEGVCQEYDCPCIATKEYLPVCGNNGKTYSNKHVLACDAHCKKAVIRVEHQGKC